MPNPVQNNDAAYQPPVKGYSYSNPNPTGNQKKRLNIFFTLTVAIFALLFLFFIFLAVLNYFRIISLSNIAPVAEKLPVALSPTPTPAPSYNSENNIWTIDATLYGYDNYKLKVKFHNQIIALQFIPGESGFYTQISSRPQPVGTESGIVQIPGFFSDLEQEQNIGKKVNVQYTKDSKGNNLIQIITLEN